MGDSNFFRIKYDKLLHLVSSMRTAQHDYNKYKGYNYKEKARRKEREVDEFIKKENQLKNQTTLFNNG